MQFNKPALFGFNDPKHPFKAGRRPRPCCFAAAIAFTQTAALRSITLDIALPCQDLALGGVSMVESEER